MQSLSSILSHTYEDIGIRERTQLESLRREWASLVGSTLSLHTSPAQLRDGVLTVHVDSPVWLQEMKYHRHSVEDRVTLRGIKEVRFKRGGVMCPPNAACCHTKPSTCRTLSEAEQTWIMALTDPIKDDLLRQDIVRAVSKSLRKSR